MSNEQLAVMSIWNVLPSTKDQVKRFTDELIEGLTADDAIHGAIQVAAVEKIIKAVRTSPEFREHVTNELDKYPGRKCTYNGNELQNVETGVKYSYNNDAKLNELNEKLDQVKAEIAERQKFLKSLPLNGKVFDEETGERIYAAVKSSTTNYKVILK